MAIQTTRRECSFNGEEGVGFCCVETLLLGTVKDFIGYLLFCPYIFAVSTVLYLLRLARPKVQVRVA